MMSSVTEEPLESIVTPSRLLALRVSCGIADTEPMASPVQSRMILFASVVFPALGGPYIPILALFFLNKFLNQVNLSPNFFIMPIVLPQYLISVPSILVFRQNSESFNCLLEHFSPGISTG